jgi:hypothetical protein
MVEANRANTKTKIQTPLSCPPRPEDRGSMHLSRPREADWVARWLLGQRGARGGWAGACGAARLARGDQQTAAGATLTRSAGDDRRNQANPAARARRRGQVNDRCRQGPRAKISGEDR